MSTSSVGGTGNEPVAMDTDKSIRPTVKARRTLTGNKAGSPMSDAAAQKASQSVLKGESSSSTKRGKIEKQVVQKGIGDAPRDIWGEVGSFLDPKDAKAVAESFKGGYRAVKPLLAPESPFPAMKSFTKGLNRETTSLSFSQVKGSFDNNIITKEVIERVFRIAPNISDIDFVGCSLDEEALKFISQKCCGENASLFHIRNLTLDESGAKALSPTDGSVCKLRTLGIVISENETENERSKMLGPSNTVLGSLFPDTPLHLEEFRIKSASCPDLTAEGLSNYYYDDVDPTHPAYLNPNPELCKQITHLEITKELNKEGGSSPIDTIARANLPNLQDLRLTLFIFNDQCAEALASSEQLRKTTLRLKTVHFCCTEYGCKNLAQLEKLERLEVTLFPKTINALNSRHLTHMVGKNYHPYACFAKLCESMKDKKELEKALRAAGKGFNKIKGEQLSKMANLGPEKLKAFHKAVDIFEKIVIPAIENNKYPFAIMQAIIKHKDAVENLQEGFAILHFDSELSGENIFKTLSECMKNKLLSPCLSSVTKFAKIQTECLRAKSKEGSHLAKLAERMSDEDKLKKTLRSSGVDLEKVAVSPDHRILVEILPLHKYSQATQAALKDDLKEMYNINFGEEQESGDSHMEDVD